jgi:Flp pilus assembly protein TadG
MQRSTTTIAERSRRGAAAVEAAVVLSVLLLLLFGILDLGLGVARYDVLSAAARDVARAAIVHGARSSPEMSPWGPAEFAGFASDSSEIAAAAKTSLATMNDDDVRIQVQWLDGDNQEGSRVRVVLKYIHQGLPLLGLGEGVELRAESTMQIVH